jgi:hypothetical protein
MEIEEDEKKKKKKKKKKSSVFAQHTCQRELVAEYDTKHPPVVSSSAYVSAQNVYKSCQWTKKRHTKPIAIQQLTASLNRGIAVSACALQYNSPKSYDQSD